MPGAAAASSTARRALPALVILGGLLYAASHLHDLPGEGRTLSLSLLLGLAFGIVLQRTRFCFYCMMRDYFEHRNALGLLGLVAALLAGTLGYHVLFGAFLPSPVPGRLPPGAHIGPVSWVLAAGALIFGLGMALSGSCISAHLYRLGEGAAASPFALLGALIGFGLGFASWNTLYLSAIQSAPVAWLPHTLGYGGSALLQIALLGSIAWLLLRTHRPPGTPEDTQPMPPISLTALLTRRWAATTGGLLVALIAVLAYLRIAPLGVTAELGSIARTLAAGWALLPDRLEGLDSFAGCATVVKSTLLSPNGAFVLALIGGAWAAALATGQFRPQWPDWRAASRNFGGGILMGWGAMVALGCTVGTLLSGIMAAAVSGWIFALFCVAGAWIGWRLRVHVASRPRIS